MFVKDNIRLTYYFHHSIKMLLFIHKRPLFFIGSADGKERSSLSSADTPTDATQIPAHLILPPSKRPLPGAGQSGYRPSGHGLLYYLASVFQIHNETVNIWTHLLAFLLVLYRWLSLSADPSFDPAFHPVLSAFSLCCLAYTFCSTMAHTFHSKSPETHYLCFQVDYAGIGFYTLGCSIYVFHAI